jgi:hypothetical protein
VDAFKARVSGRGLAISEAERNRLVKAAKCPTKEKVTEIAHQNWNEEGRLLAIQNQTRENRTVSEKFGHVGGFSEVLPPGWDLECIGGTKFELKNIESTGELVPYINRRNIKGPGRYTVITHRPWSGEYRVRTEVELPHARPPEQSGERLTTQLSFRGARAISDSCQYMSLEHGGYSTFLTLTFDESSRQRLAKKESTIQKETSRFFDSLQKMFQRGWTGNTESGKVKVSGSATSLKYCWVAENPKNSEGEDNPHLHILMSWNVPYELFKAWAARIEKLWGQGFAHLELIRKPEMAGAYMAKAAGYLTKGSNKDDQGEIKGNRYGISKESRAPDWELYGRFHMGIMPSLIKDAYDYFGYRFGHLFSERKELNSQLTEIKKAPKTKLNTKERMRIGAVLETTRKKLAKLPAIACKHQITLKTKEGFDEFMGWCKSQSGVGTAWLPQKSIGECWNDEHKSQSLWYGEFKSRQEYKLNREGRFRLWEKTEEYWNNLFDTFDNVTVEEHQCTHNDYDEYLLNFN